ncbi:hypothetical protein IFT59_18905 [Rhizobium sp. CFBP 8752]|uniref:hypothetical protein n=1 Tax=Rhizobium sp. CFBP 8752 TaxID=2775301 RepID=UPI00178431CA|nr:hypothetical protein [Rhizobium sp. CFBP 8752]MBD8665314.1 hypothetical protein [Rhizobium sp. CFBP 8752]
MATLDELVANRVLLRERIKLGRKEFDDRKLYVSPEFRLWLRGTVPHLEPFYETNIKPRMQAYELIKSFIIGRPFRGSRLFKRMSPRSDDIYELRTPDLRFFGWFPAVDVFLAVKGDDFETLKLDASLYEKHRLETRAFRNDLDLNDPKYNAGAGEHNVVSC